MSQNTKNHTFSYCIDGFSYSSSALKSGLYLVSTPIGNLADITLRALKTLCAVDLILAEDTRQSRKLLTHYGITRPLEAYHEHNGEKMRPKVLQALELGKSVALISDAGTPTISDPGYKLVRDVVEGGFHVEAAPGASAVLCALVGSGLPTDRFLFEGFLPSSKKERHDKYTLWQNVGASVVVYESAKRITKLVEEIALSYPHWQLVIGRELTKMYEEYLRGEAQKLAQDLPLHTHLKGECVLVIGPKVAQTSTMDMTFEDDLQNALKVLGHKEAVQMIAEKYGMPKRTVYTRALALKGD